MSLLSDFIFAFHPERRDNFRKGELIQQWGEKYPDLFDADDFRILKTEHQRKYHFFEWLSAVLLFESTGYISLMENYCSKNHPRKIDLFSRLVPEAVHDYLMNARSGHPDLFSFHPQTEDWFFSEVKGATDTLKENQILMHQELERMTNKKVRIVQLDELAP